MLAIVIVCLVLIAGSLAYAMGHAMGRRFQDERREQGWAEGFEVGADVSKATRHIGERARRFGR